MLCLKRNKSNVCFFRMFSFEIVFKFDFMQALKFGCLFHKKS